MASNNVAIPPHIQAFWDAYLRSGLAPLDASERFLESFSIGANSDDAAAGAKEIVTGRKTATSSLLWEIEAEDLPMPYVGALSVLEDGASNPVCVVESTWVEVLSYGDVDADFARDYGETDGTLDDWRRVFSPYYQYACSQLGRTFSDQTPLVCERFAVRFLLSGD